MTRRKVPYTIRKTTKKECFKVMNRRSRKVFSRCSTFENAVRQDRLLRAILYNPNFKKIT
jgi:hypothetical protein